METFFILINDGLQKAKAGDYVCAAICFGQALIMALQAIHPAHGSTEAAAVQTDIPTDIVLGAKVTVPYSDLETAVAYLESLKPAAQGDVGAEAIPWNIVIPVLWDILLRFLRR